MMRGRKRWYANRCLGILLTPSILGFSTLMEVVASTPTRMGPEFEVDWETFPSTRISLPSKVDGRARASLSTFSWRMGYSRRLGNNHSGLITSRLRYKRRKFDYSLQTPSSRIGGVMPETLYSLDYQVAWIANVSDRYSSLVLFNPVLENGAISLKPKDFKFTGGAIFRIALDTNTVGLGAIWSRAFGQGLLIPLIHLIWKDESRPFTLRATLPISAELWYAPHRYWELGMVADVEGSEYRVDDLDYASREEDEEDIRYSLVTVGPELGLHMMRFFHISFRGGISLARRFDAVDDQGNHRARDFRNGFFRSDENERRAQILAEYADSVVRTSSKSAIAVPSRWQ